MILTYSIRTKTPLLIWDLFYEVSISECAVSNGKMISEFGKMWKEAVLVYYCLLSRSCLKGLRKATDIFSWIRLPPAD